MEINRRFIQDFSKIAKLNIALLCKKVNFDFTSKCQKAFEEIKGALMSSLVVQAPDWILSLEKVRDASYFAVGAVLRKKRDNKSHVVY